MVPLLSNWMQLFFEQEDLSVIWKVKEKLRLFPTVLIEDVENAILQGP